MSDSQDEMTRKPFDGRFEPITYEIGFLRADFDSVVEVYTDWMRSLLRLPKYRTFRSLTNNPLLKFLARPIDEAVRRRRSASEHYEVRPLKAAKRNPLLEFGILEPVGGQNIFWEAADGWVAHLGNGSRGADVDSTMSVLTRDLSCVGVIIHCNPHVRSKEKSRHILLYGSRGFRLIGPNRDKWYESVRSLQVSYQSRWEFDSYGEPQPFEQVECYEEKDVKKRLTPRMVEDYARALGIRFTEDDFYGDRAMYFNRDPRDEFLEEKYGHRIGGGKILRQKRNRKTLAEVRAELGID